MQIGSPGLTFGNGTLSQVVNDGAAIRRQLDTLTRQAGDGLVADTYAGLGAAAAIPLSLASAIDEATTWQANTQAAAGPMQTEYHFDMPAVRLLKELAKRPKMARVFIQKKDLLIDIKG